MSELLDDGLLRLLLTVLACGLVLVLVGRLPAGKEDAEHPLGGHFPRQVATLLGGLVAVVLVILALPVDTTLRGQLLSLFGLAVTALVTLSSTTFVSNAMAGLMLRALDNFHAGDFIRVDAHFGRVTERGLLHTEIQTEDRDLVTLPNLFIITQPTRVVRASGTLVSVDVSLGYDVPRGDACAALERAVTEAELSEPFVRVTGLADHAVCYRASGFLEDVRTLVSARARLHGAALDTLHDAGIEIVSPGFMNQRRLADGVRIIPERRHQSAAQPSDADGSAERIMFDKAETEARLSGLALERKALLAEIEALEDAPASGDDGSTPDPEHRDAEVERLRGRLEALEEQLEQEQAANDPKAK